MEELRALAWGFDTRACPQRHDDEHRPCRRRRRPEARGSLRRPRPLYRRTPTGFVDYIDPNGNKLGGGGIRPDNAIYIRRWSIEPLPTNPNNTLVIQVLVTRHRTAARPIRGSRPRLPDEARMISVKTRKAQ